MAAAPLKIVMSGKPLTGLQSVGSGSRIVIWDHFDSAIVFVGKITRMISQYEAVGENYIHDPKTDGKFSEPTRLDFRKYGLARVRTSGDGLHPRFRTYALPGPVAPCEYKRIEVTYKTPEQLRRKEVLLREYSRSKV